MLVAFAFLVPAAVVVAHNGAPEVASHVVQVLVAHGVDAQAAPVPLSEPCARNPACPDRPQTSRIVWVDSSVVEVVSAAGDVIDRVQPSDLDVDAPLARVLSAVQVAEAPPAPATPPQPPEVAPAPAASPATSPSSSPPTITPEDSMPWIIAAAAGAGIALLGVVALAVFATESPTQQAQDAGNCVSTCGGELIDNCLTAVLNGCINGLCNAFCGFTLQNAPRTNTTPAGVLPPPPSTRPPSLRPAMRY